MKRGNHMSKDRFPFVMKTRPLWLSPGQILQKHSVSWERKCLTEGGLSGRSCEERKEVEESREHDGKAGFCCLFPSLVPQGSSGIPQWLALMVTPGSPCLWEKSALDESFCSLEANQGLTCPVLGSKSVLVSQGCCNKMSHIYLLSYSSRGSVPPIRACIGFAPLENFKGRISWKPVPDL